VTTEELLEKYKLPLGLGLIGLILVGIGTLAMRQLGGSSSDTVEILTVEEETGVTIFADLEGAVEKPGVYELPGDARINDLLIRAGGLSAAADREWVAKNINLAQKLTDGAKIYVPSQQEQTGQIAGSSTAKSSLVNINTASASQLDSLWGIGSKRAEDIISNRPYQTIEELKTKAGIPSNVYERIKEEVTLY